MEDMINNMKQKPSKKEQDIKNLVSDAIMKLNNVYDMKLAYEKSISDYYSSLLNMLDVDNVDQTSLRKTMRLIYIGYEKITKAFNDTILKAPNEWEKNKLHESTETKKKGTKTMTTKRKSVKPKCPDDFTLDFARNLVRYLGGDESKITNNDCWRSLGLKFPDLVQKAMNYFESDKTGNPSNAAYCLVYYCGAPLRWAMGVVEKAKTGDPSDAAYRLVCSCEAPLEWAMGVVEKAKTGNPSNAAWYLVRYYEAPLEWAMGVVEKAKTGDPSDAAWYLVRYCGAPLEWAMKVVEKAKTGDSSDAACHLVQDCNAPRKWYDEKFGT